MMSASTQPDILQAARQLDVNGYLLKLLEPERLRNTIVKARSRYFPVNFAAYSVVPVPSYAA